MSFFRKKAAKAEPTDGTKKPKKPAKAELTDGTPAKTEIKDTVKAELAFDQKSNGSSRIDAVLSTRPPCGEPGKSSGTLLSKKFKVKRKDGDWEQTDPLSWEQRQKPKSLVLEKKRKKQTSLAHGSSLLGTEEERARARERERAQERGEEETKEEEEEDDFSLFFPEERGEEEEEEAEEEEEEEEEEGEKEEEEQEEEVGEEEEEENEEQEQEQEQEQEEEEVEDEDEDENEDENEDEDEDEEEEKSDHKMGKDKEGENGEKIRPHGLSPNCNSQKS
jgi:hypothetical protein